MRMGCPKCGIAMEIKSHWIGMEAMTSNGAYAYLDGDLWHCPQCSIEVVMGWRTRDYGSPAKPVFRIWLNQREKKQYEKQHSGG